MASVKPYQGLWFVFPLLKCFVFYSATVPPLILALAGPLSADGKHLKVLTLICTPLSHSAAQPAKPDNHTWYFGDFLCLEPLSDEPMKHLFPPGIDVYVSLAFFQTVVDCSSIKLLLHTYWVMHRISCRFFYCRNFAVKDKEIFY